MTQNLITKINGADIVTVEKDGDIYVPIKPICEALTISFTGQIEKLKSDPTFSESTIRLSRTVAADGKEREMLCLPLMLVFLWLGSINPANVAESARPAVIQYRLECARVLYEHFTGSMRKTLEDNRAEIELLKEINLAIAEEKDAKIRRRQAQETLEQLRTERLNPAPCLFY